MKGRAWLELVPKNVYLEYYYDYWLFLTKYTVKKRVKSKAHSHPFPLVPSPSPQKNKGTGFLYICPEIVCAYREHLLNE